MLSDITGTPEYPSNFSGVKEEKAPGLFVLNYLGTVENAQLHGVSNYGNSGHYYLASPDFYANYIIWYIRSDGTGNGASNRFGVRPVISINGVQMNWDSEKDRWEME